MLLTFALISILILCCNSAELPTNYEYYTSGGIKSGLSADGDSFTLNGKQITIFSGSLHYFRVPRQYWRDRLMKMKAAGLNAVQFYSPWNLHEEIPGNFDFESGFLNLTDFLVAIKEADLFALHRPGPYICSEWEFGGVPAWLLRDPNMKVRSNYGPFVTASQKYMEKIVDVIKNFQFSTNGGPIIAMQIENEFQSFGDTDKSTDDVKYLTALKDSVKNKGFKELLYTSDPWVTTKGSLPDLLRTANFNAQAVEFLTALKKSQPNKALYVAEYWSGWFDKWGETHHTTSLRQYSEQYENIIFKMNSSVNIYMFHGGTNFGFMSGDYVITSYDYDAPLNEYGNYTEKYWKTKEIIERFNKERNAPKIKSIDPPKVAEPKAYGVSHVTHYLPYDALLPKLKAITSQKPIRMELLDIGTNYGQNFGFTVYRTKITKASNIKLTGGLYDRVFVVIDGKFVFTDRQFVGVKSDVNFTLHSALSVGSEHTLDIIVECMGRSNGGHIMNEERQGLAGDVLIDGNVQTNFTIYPLDFQQKFVEELSKSQSWMPFSSAVEKPALYKLNLQINDTQPSDTFLKLDFWHSGIVFVNGFNVGRYWNIGPQQTLYIPAPYLKTGQNEIYIFEMYDNNAINALFIDRPILG